MKSDVLAVIKAAEQEYIAPDGLMMLGPGELVKGRYPFKLNSAGNDNGIMYLSLYVLLLYKLDSLTERVINQFYNAATSLMREPGLMNRNPGRTDSLNSHDNTTSVCAVSAMLKKDIHTQVYEYGRKHGYFYNNVDPGKKVLRSWRQPSSIAFHKLICGYSPSLVESIWLTLSNYVNAWQTTFRTSEHMLQWMMLESIKAKKLELPRYLKASMDEWYLQLKRKGGMSEIFSRYFIDTHPIVRLGKLLQEK